MPQGDAEDLAQKLDEAWEQLQEAHLALGNIREHPLVEDQNRLGAVVEAMRHYYQAVKRIEDFWRRSA